MFGNQGRLFPVSAFHGYRSPTSEPLSCLKAHSGYNHQNAPDTLSRAWGFISKAFSSLLLCLLIFPLPSALPAKIRQRAAGERCCAQGASALPRLLSTGTLCWTCCGLWEWEGRVCLPPSPPQFQVYLSKLIERVVPTQGDALQRIWLLILEMLISHLGQMVTC